MSARWSIGHLADMSCSIILISVYVLMVSNPGPAFGQAQRETGLENALGEPKV